MKAADLFVACLAEEGVTHVFGVPGEENLDLLEALRESSIEFVVTRHEQHAAFMAATHGRLTGRAGVCLSTLGPGATNLLTGIAHAQLGGMPLVAITGQKALHHNWQGNFQLVDVIGCFEPLTKWNQSIATGDSIPRFVRYAFKVAEGERPGAVHLELPEDVAAHDVPDGVPQRRVSVRRPTADETALDDAAALIRGARNPVLIVSAGANRKRVGEQLRSFVETTGIGAVATQTGKGVLPDDHPRSLFSLGIHKKDGAHVAIERADLVICVGYDIVEYPPAVWNEDHDKQILHVDFTEAEPDLAYNPACELVGDIAASLEGLCARLSDVDFADAEQARLRTILNEMLHPGTCSDCIPVSYERVVHDVREVMQRRDIVSLDNTIAKLWFARGYATYADNTLLLDNALATMGAGLAAGMTAKMLQPGQRVLVVAGDGGFMMNSQDLETSVRLGLDLVVLILRDDTYGFIRWKQKMEGFAEHALSFGNPDYVKYAEAYGAHGLRVGEPDSLADTLRAAYAHGGVVLVDCPVDNTENDRLATDLAADVRRQMEQKS
ncbi:MAG: acetolactate synthase large subunit [Planctomycetota bacterium]|nr:MAG: acetolactate synthase large subunit [Planctomycetota bacterium]